MGKILNKWIGAYEGVKRLQGSGWSETDVLAKAQELYACGKNFQFTLMEEWHALRDQPCYGSQVGGSIRRRYRMQKHVFLRIVGDLSSSDNYFTQRVDAYITIRKMYHINANVSI